MPTHLVYNLDDFLFDLHEFDGENVEWSWRYTYSKVELWSDNANRDWTRNATQITYAANELYSNKPPDYGFKRFFYQTLGWHWNSEDRALKRGNQPPYYVFSGNLARLTAKLNLDDDDMLRRSLEDELEYKEGYHRHRLQMNADDAILHRVSLETKAWPNVGPSPRRRVPMSDPIERVEQHEALKFMVLLPLNLHHLNFHPLEHCHHEYFSG